MRNIAFRSATSVLHREAGTSVIEFALAMPGIVLVMVLLIAMGHAVILKQHSMVAARYAGFYARVTGQNPPGFQTGEETWTATTQAQDEWAGSILQGNLIAGILDGFILQNSRGASIHAQAQYSASRTLYSGKVQAEYDLPNASNWTGQSCGMFRPLLPRFQILNVNVFY